MAQQDKTSTAFRPVVSQPSRSMPLPGEVPSAFRPVVQQGPAAYDWKAVHSNKESSAQIVAKLSPHLLQPYQSAASGTVTLAKPSVAPGTVTPGNVTPANSTAAPGAVTPGRVTPGTVTFAKPSAVPSTVVVVKGPSAAQQPNANTVNAINSSGDPPTYAINTPLDMLSKEVSREASELPPPLELSPREDAKISWGTSHWDQPLSHQDDRSIPIQGFADILRNKMFSMATPVDSEAGTPRTPLGKSRVVPPEAPPQAAVLPGLPESPRKVSEGSQPSATEAKPESRAAPGQPSQFATVKFESDRNLTQEEMRRKLAARLLKVEGRKPAVSSEDRSSTNDIVDVDEDLDEDPSKRPIEGSEKAEREAREQAQQKADVQAERRVNALVSTKENDILTAERKAKEEAEQKSKAEAKHNAKEDVEVPAEVLMKSDLTVPLLKDASWEPGEEPPSLTAPEDVLKPLACSGLSKTFSVLSLCVIAVLLAGSLLAGHVQGAVRLPGSIHYSHRHAAAKLHSPALQQVKEQAARRKAEESGAIAQQRATQEEQRQVHQAAQWKEAAEEAAAKQTSEKAAAEEAAALEKAEEGARRQVQNAALRANAAKEAAAKDKAQKAAAERHAEQVAWQKRAAEEAAAAAKVAAAKHKAEEEARRQVQQAALRKKAAEEAAAKNKAETAAAERHAEQVAVQQQAAKAAAAKHKAEEEARSQAQHIAVQHQAAADMTAKKAKEETAKEFTQSPSELNSGRSTTAINRGSSVDSSSTRACKHQHCDGGKCHQQGCFKPTCAGGRCQQAGAIGPTCDGGHCDQRGAVRPSCEGKHCLRSPSRTG